MKTNIKRLLPILAIASTMFTAPAFAYEDAKEYKVNQAVPPSKYPTGTENNNFFASAAYTYWAPYQEGLNIAIARNNLENQGDIIRPAMASASGFKIGLGANLQHDGWVIAANYTWFYCPTDMAKNTLVDTLDYTPIFAPDTFRYVTLDSQFAMQLNRVDLTIDRSFWSGHFLSIRPWLGLVGACDRQHLNYKGTIAGGQNNVLGVNIMQEDWWGVGPYTGSEATYYFNTDWGFYISSGVSMLLTHRYVQTKDFNYQADGTVDDVVNYNHTSFNGVEPLLEATIGVRWDANWTNWGLRLDLGWEFQKYFSHNGFQGYYSPVGILGDFSMQGLTFAARVNF
jgi:hypothetical protein